MYISFATLTFSYLEQIAGIQGPGADRRHLAPERSVARPRDTDVQHLRDRRIGRAGRDKCDGGRRGVVG